MSQKQKLELRWVGKDEQPILEPRILIEDPKKSYGDPSSENMLIHGDNLLALKALEQDFTGKIKCIYIDPPFNTGAAFEHYEDGLEHSIWLGLMHQRFKILHSLLRSDGVIFVNLDDNEAAYCKVLLDEIFGRSNYLNHIINATNKPFGFKSTAGALFRQANHIFLYARNKDQLSLNAKAMFIEKQYDVAYKYVFKDMELPEEQWEWDLITNVVAKQEGYSSSREAKSSLGEAFNAQVALFALQNADRVFRTASVSGGAFLKRKNTIEISKKKKKEIVRHPNDDMDYQFIGGERILYYKERLNEIDGYLLPGELITDIWSDISIEGLAKEGGVNFPKGKKPEKLIQRCMELTSSEGDWILDSFLGSGTTASVAQKINRKWIGIELGEQCYTHCLPRLQNVIKGTDKTGITKAVNWQGGGGFKFYDLAPSLLQKDPYDNWIINPEYNGDMLAAAMAKHEGFKYNPSQETYWKQGQSTEKDYIYTTTQFVTIAMLDQIHDEMQADESLLICCKSYSRQCSDKYKNITIKKIPKLLLGKCEFSKEDYSLNIINMPEDEDQEEDGDNIEDVEIKPVKKVKSKAKPKAKKKVEKSKKRSYKDVDQLTIFH